MGRSADVPRASGDGNADDSGCNILHVDMDAFYASVEMRKNPALRGKPVVVGGGVRGVVAAASYEARRYGVRSAMPMTRALRLCPRAVVVPPDRAAYVEASTAVMNILRTVTPLVQPLSLDEAFLDVTGAVRAQGRPALIAARIRADISTALALTCSVGIAPTKFVAKVASARCKPDGLMVVPADRVLEFLHPLPVTVLWGVGARTGESLRRLGIRTIGDLAGTPLDTLRRAVGVAIAEQLSALAHGVDERAVRTDEVEKSISSDRTLDTDLTDAGGVRSELLRLSGDVARRMRERGLVSRTVGIKIRFADFSTVTRVRTLPTWTDSTSAVYSVAAELFAGLALDRPRIRLVGVRCENLLDAGAVVQQLSFDDLIADRVSPIDQPPATRQRHATRASDTVLDAARAKFGGGVLGFASLLRQPSDAPQPAQPGISDADR